MQVQEKAADIKQPCHSKVNLKMLFLPGLLQGSL